MVVMMYCMWQSSWRGWQVFFRRRLHQGTAYTVIFWLVVRVRLLVIRQLGWWRRQVLFGWHLEAVVDFCKMWLWSRRIVLAWRRGQIGFAGRLVMNTWNFAIPWSWRQKSRASLVSWHYITFRGRCHFQVWILVG